MGNGRDRGDARLRDPQPHDRRGHAPPGARHAAARDGPPVLPEPLERDGRGTARLRPRQLLAHEPVADPDRDRPDAADPPVPRGAGARGGGARRPEDGSLQRSPLCDVTRRGARSRSALRAAAVADHGRPRPPARHQQHVRASRRGRSAAWDRADLPGAAPPLRRACPVRRRGVLDPAPGDSARPGARDRRADPTRGRRGVVRGRDLERADPRDRVDRCVRLPEGRDRRERADPPGRPRRLSREAPGPQPRAGRQRRLAPGQRGSFTAARRRARRTETTSSRFRAPQSRSRRKTAARSRLRVRSRSRAHGSSRSHAASGCSSAR